MKNHAMGALVAWELKKLWSVPMIWVFLLLCLLFHVSLAAGDRYGNEAGDYAVYVGNAIKTTGSRMGRTFTGKAMALPEHPYKETLLTQTRDARDIFETYDAAHMAELVTELFHMNGWPARAMAQKYGRQQAVVEELARRDDALDVCSAGMTEPLTDALFQTQCRALLTEAVLLAILMALYTSGCERLAGTRLLVYSTRTGRMVQWPKALAGLISALVSYLVLAACAILFFALIWYPAPDWSASISSQFHMVYTMGMKLPFIPWHPFTLGGYLLAVLILGLVVTALFYGLAFGVGLWTRSPWQGFLLMLILLALNLLLVMVSGDSRQWVLFSCAQWSPAALWYTQSMWFTDMSINAIVPWQECRVTAVWLVLCGILLLLAFRHMYRADCDI